MKCRKNPFRQLPASTEPTRPTQTTVSMRLRDQPPLPCRVFGVESNWCRFNYGVGSVAEGVGQAVLINVKLGMNVCKTEA